MVELPQAEFDAFVSAQIAILREKPKTMLEQYRRFWSEIIERTHMFDRRTSAARCGWSR